MDFTEFYTISVKPQLDAIYVELSTMRASFEKFAAGNEQAHKEIVSDMDAISNGNGIMGHRQLVKEWTEYKKARRRLGNGMLGVVLTGVNTVLALILTALFVKVTKLMGS